MKFLFASQFDVFSSEGAGKKNSLKTFSAFWQQTRKKRLRGGGCRGKED